MRRHWQRTLVIAVCAGGLGGSVPLTPAAEPALVSVDVLRLGRGEVREETLELPPEHYFEIEIEQVEGDVAVELLDPLGMVVAGTDLPGKPWVREVLAGVAGHGGVYRLRVLAKTEVAAIVELGRLARPATAGERALVTALAHREKAQRLKEDGTKESIESAIESFERSLDSLEGAGDSIWLGRVLREVGRCRARTGDGEAAESDYSRSISVLRQSGDLGQLSRSLNFQGVLQLERGDRPAARETFDEALRLAAAAGDSGSEAEAWNNLGVYHYYQGEMERVVESFEKSLAVSARAGRIEGRANTLANLGEVYRSLGRYADALELSEQSLALARRLGDPSQEMRVLNNRGVLLKGTGDLRAAVEDYEASLELSERLGDVRWQANIGSNLGGIYRVMGHRRRALEYLHRALDAAREAGSASNEIRVLLTIGELLREGADPEAETFLRQARKKSIEHGDRGGEAYSLLGLGRRRLDVGDPAVAEEYLALSLELLTGTSDRPGQLAAHRELARSLAVLGDSERAERHFAEAVALARLLGDPYQEALARARRARFLLDAGDPLAAQDDVSLALSTIESLRDGVVGPDLRAGLLSRSQEDFTLLVDILETLHRRYPRQGYLERAFEVAERSRARSLVELLTESEADLIRDLPRDLRRRRSDLSGRLSASQRELTESMTAESLDTERSQSLRDEVHRLNLEREVLEREIRLTDPRWSRLSYPKALDIGAAQDLLEPKQALVSFVLGEHGSFVFVITPTDLVLERIASEDVLRPRIEELRKHLEVPGRRSMGRLRSLAADLYDDLLGPVEGLLEEQEHLLISPDGLLHYLPFEVLVRPGEQDAAGRYLLSTWAVSYLPSASTLDALKRRGTRSPSAPFDLAAFADPRLPGEETESGATGEVLRGLGDQASWNWRRLAGARAEVEAIAGLFDPARVRVAYGAEATEDRFRNEVAVREARYVHVAAHALIDNEEPALSALLLSVGTENTDGLLQAHEIFDLQLDADLVVLSGCETALGRAVRGEGLLGMTRAFLYAGADAVAVSLWPVEDQSTAGLMHDFYRGLTAGEATAEALRKAKLASIEDSRYSHPYYWAPFVVVGSPS